MFERIEGFCYCTCGHTAGKHTTPDVKQNDWRCRERGCNCKAYTGAPERADGRMGGEGEEVKC